MIIVLLLGMLAAENAKPLAKDDIVDAVVVLKSERTLELLARGRVIRSYKVQLGGEPRGSKERQGDHKTPEGNYLLDWRNPQSGFYKSIHVSYPTDQQKDNAKKKGIDPGGLIMIHGQENGKSAAELGQDWTDGCIAVTNSEMDEIWRLVPDRTPIEIKP